MEWFVGTSGYSYPAWKGSFYPEDLSSSEMLGYYATRLGAVEINNTFYRLPKPEVLRGWADQVPGAFRFVIKASRRITHFTRLGAEAAEPTAFLVRSVEALEDRLGAVLFQLPPNMKADVGRLRAFLDALPSDLPAAFEFRHPSWDDEAVRETLAGHGAAQVCADTEEAEDDPPIHGTADWAYVRLRRASYDEAALDRWMGRLDAHARTRAFVFFKHEDAGAGPRMAESFMARARP